MRMSTLEEAFTLQSVGLGEWKGYAHPGYEATSGMFGGWTAGVLLKAIIDDARAEGTPSALTVHFLKSVPPESDVSIRSRRVGGGRSLSFWQSELFLARQDDPAALAMLVLANRRESDAFTDVCMPDAAEPESLSVFHPPGPFGQRTPFRPLSGHPPFSRPDTQSMAWVRETSGRSIDFPQLAYLCDAYAPRIFFKSTTPRPSSTITLSAYFHASEAEMRGVGEDYVLTQAQGTRAELSTIGSKANLWSRQRTLLASTEQLCWFR